MRVCPGAVKSASAATRTWATIGPSARIVRDATPCRVETDDEPRWAAGPRSRHTGCPRCARRRTDVPRVGRHHGSGGGSPTGRADRRWVRTRDAVLPVGERAAVGHRNAGYQSDCLGLRRHRPFRDDVRAGAYRARRRLPLATLRRSLRCPSRVCPTRARTVDGARGSSGDPVRAGLLVVRRRSAQLADRLARSRRVRRTKPGARAPRPGERGAAGTRGLPARSGHLSVRGIRGGAPVG